MRTVFSLRLGRWAISWGAIPIGALLGGLPGDVLGLRAAIAAGMVGTLLAPLWLILTPVRTLRRTPMPAAVEAAGEFAS